MATRRGLFAARAVTALATFPIAGLLFLAPVAWGKDPKVVVFPGRDAAALPNDAGTVSRIPPDPPAMKSRMQWVFDLKWSQGDPSLLGVHALDLGAAQETPRSMGRFALELFEGPTLIERVRFDFPLLGAGEETDGGWHAPPAIERKLTTRIGVVFPATPRGTRLELWDRATDRRWPLPWPVDADAGATPGDARADAAK